MVHALQKTGSSLTPREAIPAVISATGDAGVRRFVEFFTANIRNANTRNAYFRACTRFFGWFSASGLALRELEPVHVAAYVEILGKDLSAPTVKQHLAALRMLFDWMVVGQVMAFNPAASVRGPKHVVEEGKTPILDADQARQLFASLNGTRPIDLRDRALVGMMVFSFARVSAVTNMQVKDYRVNGSKAWIRLSEKGGKQRQVPAHHILREYIESYINAAGIADQKNTPLFRSAGPGRSKDGSLTEKGMSRFDVLALVKRVAKKAGLSEEVCNHSFRGTGITNFLENDGDLETAAWIAGHSSTRTTKLYDRRQQEVSQAEIERIRF